ncbi:unnamed protein product [Pelagomonas calceolata]|uniref:HD domain-containing protein n=1 Tax=Pelagomonas calceolata TaxID=35677 RepID=A0A8J2SWL6_9STRA|nr:unnamed protein product [Pelagomonas calceolata]|mmetsp:Transcript_5972/g.16885  ORF Transcript_5972/g.16885 Transcript_5972/m.16885 type:complete len:392 (-) Transcript_5972:51-1226(-)
MAQTPPQPLRERRCASFGEPAQARSPLPRRASRPRAESDCTWNPKKRALIVVQTSWLQDHEQTCLPRLREIGTEASQGRTRLRVVVDRKRRTTVSIDVTALLGFFVLSSCLITTTALRFTPSTTPRGPSLGASAVVGAPSAPFYPSAQPEPTYPAPLRATLTLDRATKYLDDKARNEVAACVDFAARAHRGQRRADGSPFVTHPIAVATILADMEMDAATVCAGVLHDTVEDTDTSVEDIFRAFGGDVAALVNGVTDSPTASDAVKRAAVLEAAGHEWRVGVLKLADRLHNMRTLGAMPRPKRLKKATETLEVYAPLAEKLGFDRIADELVRLGASEVAPAGLGGLARRVSPIAALVAAAIAPAALDSMLKALDLNDSLERKPAYSDGAVE